MNIEIQGEVALELIFYIPVDKNDYTNTCSFVVTYLERVIVSQETTLSISYTRAIAVTSWTCVSD